MNRACSLIVGIFAFASLALLAGVPTNVQVTVGPSLIRVKKATVAYKLWVFSVSYDYEGEHRAKTLSCLYADSDSESQPPSLDECRARLKTAKVNADVAVTDPTTPKEDDEVVESGMTCRYDSMSPLVMTTPDGDTVCATPKICKDGKGKDEVSHVSCNVKPEKRLGTSDGKVSEFFVCPRLKGCQAEQFIAKNMGRRTSIASEQNAASSAATTSASAASFAPSRVAPAAPSKKTVGRGAHK